MDTLLLVALVLIAAALLIALRLSRYASQSRRKRHANWEKIVNQIREEDLED
jgi:competence protein ComGF